MRTIFSSANTYSKSFEVYVKVCINWMFHNSKLQPRLNCKTLSVNLLIATNSCNYVLLLKKPFPHTHLIRFYIFIPLTKKSLVVIMLLQRSWIVLKKWTWQRRRRQRNEVWQSQTLTKNYFAATRCCLPSSTTAGIFSSHLLPVPKSGVPLFSFVSLSAWREL